MEELDVKINLQKTHSSETMFEFAKRLMVNGVEVSPYPVDGLISSTKYYLLGGFLIEQLDRGYSLPPLKGPGSIKTILDLIIGSYQSRLVKSLTRKVYDFIMMSKIILQHNDPVEQYISLVK